MRGLCEERAIELKKKSIENQINIQGCSAHIIQDFDEENKGKTINMTYDKRFIVNPQCAFEDVKIVNTLPFGHIDLDMLSLEY